MNDGQCARRNALRAGWCARWLGSCREVEMELSNLTRVWRNAVVAAAICIAACSNDDGTASTDNPIETAGAGGAAGSSMLPPSAGTSGVSGASGQGAAGNTATAGTTAEAGTTGGAAGMMAAAGSSAAGSTPMAAGSGGSGAMQEPDEACDPADKTPDPTPASFTQIMGYQ